MKKAYHIAVEGTIGVGKTIDILEVVATLYNTFLPLAKNVFIFSS